MLRFRPVIGTVGLILGIVAYSALPAWAESQANQILKASGIRAGLCVHLLSGDGKLTAELGQNGQFLVHGLETTDALVERARAGIRSQTQYGKVSVVQSDLKTLPYSEHLVNLLVLEEAPEAINRGLSIQEIVRVLIPRGVAMLGGWDANPEALKTTQAELRKLGVQEVQVISLDGAWLRILKPRPKEMDEWTHLNHNAGGNRVS